MQLERYRIEKEIGRGAMATVYCAYDTEAERMVALKLLHRRFVSDETIRARFVQEAQTIAKLRHRAIIPILHAAKVGEDIFLVMPLMAGGSLADRLKHGPLSMVETISVLERIASALDYAHSEGVIHRDVKPDNILFDESGQAYLGDFGVIKLAESKLTRTGMGLIGTPAYMSPEQVEGEKNLSGQTDLYALGVVLFEMLSGRIPFDGDSEMAIAMKHLNAPVPSLRGLVKTLQPGWQRVVNKAMAKKPADRYRSGAEMVAAARHVTTSPLIAIDRRLLLALGALMLLVAVGGGMYQLGRARGAAPAANGMSTVTATRPPASPTAAPAETPRPSATPQPPADTPQPPAATSSPAPVATTLPAPTATPLPPPTATATAEPTSTQPPAPVATTLPTPVGPALSLIGPPHGIYFNPLNFTWTGPSTLTYQVVLQHPEKGFSHTSPTLSGFTWSIDIPGEQFGNWTWWVQASNGQRTEIGTFVFDSHVPGTIGIYDLNGDCRIDGLDLETIFENYGCFSGEACYNDWVDFNDDGYVGDDDVAQIESRIGQQVPNCTSP